MSDIILQQAEADSLIAIPKHRADDREWSYPDLGGAIHVPLVSEDRREQFVLDLQRGRVKLSKGTYQNRARQVIVLVRLDYGGPPHRNPNGVEIGSSHLHLYREGFGDKWAEEVPEEHFGNLSDPWQTLQDFLSYCHVVEPPEIRRGIFT